MLLELAEQGYECGEFVVPGTTATDAAAAERILVKYGISYVIVGQLERFFYPAEGIAKFDSLVGRSLEPVYATPQTVIDHVAGTPNPLTVSVAP